MRGCWGRVLIETLWNVNAICVMFRSLSHLVLIETLWNVNIYAPPEAAKKAWF